MRIYTRVVFDSEWNRIEAECEFYEYDGPIALCKGDSTAKAAEQQQAAFNAQLMTIFQSQFAKQNSILDYITPKMQSIIDNPSGYSPEALAAMRANSIDNLSNQYQSAQKALNAKELSGGGAELPSGVNAQLDEALFNAEASDKAGAENNITLSNEQLKQANYWNALSVLSGNAAQINPLGYASAATTGGNTVANLSQAYTASQGPGLMGLLGGVIGGAASVFGPGGSGTKALFGCWVASKIFGGWLAPDTIMVRNYIFKVFAKTWHGKPVAWLYSRTGQ